MDDVIRGFDFGGISNYYATSKGEMWSFAYNSSTAVFYWNIDAWTKIGEPRERGCAMVFQNYALYPHMSVADNIGYALKVAGLAAPSGRNACSARPKESASPICSIASQANFPVANASASPWGAP